MPVGVDTTDTDFDTANKTGGSKTVTLTLGQMPKHHHGFKNTGGAIVAPAIDQSKNVTWGANWTQSSDYKIASATGYEDKGNDEAHPNIQPYITTYFWRRSA